MRKSPHLPQSALNNLSTSPPKDESLMDFKVAWQYYKSNAKTFITYATFIIVGTYAVILALTGVVMYLAFVVFDVLHIDPTQDFILILMLIVNIPYMILMMALLGSLYGLAYDIMSGGDEFTEFKSALTYFRRYWWQYFLIAILADFPSMILPIYINPLFGWFHPPQNQIGVYVVVYLILVMILFGYGLLILPAMASVTSQGSIKVALQESFAIVKTNLKRLLKTGFLYYLIFGFISNIFLSVRYLLWPYFGDQIKIVFIIVVIIFIFGIYLVGTPMQVLLITRIYNTSSAIKHRPPKGVILEPKF
jgi:hypothetical protein